MSNFQTKTLTLFSQRKKKKNQISRIGPTSTKLNSAKISPLKVVENLPRRNYKPCNRALKKNLMVRVVRRETDFIENTFSSKEHRILVGNKVFWKIIIHLARNLHK